MKTLKDYIIKNLLDRTAAAVMNCEDEESLKAIISEDYEFTIVNGLLHGERKKYYYNKDKLFKHNIYEEGELHGECKVFHENGQLWVHCTYKNGKLHGERKVYDSNGILRFYCMHTNGKRTKIDYYKKNGKLDKLTTFFIRLDY